MCKVIRRPRVVTLINDSSELTRMRIHNEYNNNVNTISNSVTTLHVENVHNHQFNSSQLLKNTKFTTQCMCPETTKLFHKLEFLFYAICFIAVVNLQS